MVEYPQLLANVDVTAMVRDLLPGVDIIGAPRRLPKGYSSESSLVTTSSGTLVVKIRRQTTDRAKMQSLVEAARLAHEAGVPTAEILYAGLAAAAGGRPVVILRYLPGTDAEEALPGLDSAQRSRLFADFGAAVGRLHQIRLPHFTERIGAPEAAMGDWSTVIHHTAERCAATNARAGVLTPSEIAAIRARLIYDVAEVNDAVSPVLTHRDLYLANVLTDDGRFAALIDFELAKGYDPLLDFIRLGTFVFESWPESLQPFIHAYRQNGIQLRKVEERLALCLALELFVQVPNWTQTGDEALLRDSCQLLRGWLGGSTPWWVRQVGAALT